ncbi:Conserved_hypothetical protein [Hexamita inflata]|uniref:Uncharacterized protein n=1 Tax=Hexamita inflata TaxID=28002 RepID=A0AA86Q3S7_9EUKA|nr:Conserved hypothetical protein [Hexamita inflata]
MANPLWLSLKLNNILDAVSDFSTLQDQIGSSDYKGALTTVLKSTVGRPVVAFGLLPLIGFIIALIMFIPMVSITLCCSCYRKYSKRQNKLDKQLIKYMKSTRIMYDMKQKPRKEPFIVAQSGSSLKDPEVFNKLDKEQFEVNNKLRLQAYRCAKCSVVSWYIWFGFIVIYFVSIIYSIIGTQKIVNIPSLKSMATTIDTSKSYIDMTASSLDKSLQELLFQPPTFTPITSMVTQAEDVYDPTPLVQSMHAQQLVQNTLDPLFKLFDNGGSGDKTIFDLTRSVFYYPTGISDTNASSNIQAGKDAGTYLKNSLQGINTNIKNANARQVEITNLNKNAELPDKVKDTVPAISIPESLDKIINMPIINNLLTTILDSSVNVDKVMNAISDIVFSQSSMTALTSLKNVIIAKDAGSVATPLPTLTSILNTLNITPPFTLDTAGVISELNKLTDGFFTTDKMKNLNKNIQPYYSMLGKNLDDMFAQFLTTSNKTNPLIDIGQSFKDIPVIGSKLANMQKPSDAITALSPIIYALVLTIPLIIFAASLGCMAFKLTCCSTCSMLCCFWCSLITSILSLMLLMVSFFNSGLIQPQIKLMNSDLNALSAQIQPVLVNHTSIKPTYTFDLPTMTGITFTPPSLVIDCSSINNALNSIKMSAEVDLEALINVSIPITLKKFNINVDLTGSDFSKLFSGDSKAILNLFKVNGKTLSTIINDFIVKLNNDYLTMSGLFAKIDAENLILKVKSMDIEKLMQKVGVNLTEVVNTINTEIAKYNLCDLQTKFKESIPSCTPQEYLYIFSNITDKMSEIVVTGTTPADITITSTKALEFLQSAYINIYMEYLADSGTLQTKLEIAGAPTTDQANAFISSKIALSPTDLQTFITREMKTAQMDTFKDQYQKYDCENGAVFGTFETNNLVQRGITTSDSAKIKKLFVLQCKAVQTMLNTSANVFESSIVGKFQTEMTHLIGLSKLSDYINQILVIMNKLLLNTIGQDCAATPNTNPDALTLKIVEKVNGLMKSMLINALNSLKDTAGYITLNSILTPLSVLPKAQAMTKALKSAVNTILLENEAPINTKLLNVMTSMVADVSQTLLENMDYYSFAAYMGFLFSFFSPLFMACAYQYVALSQGDRRRKRLYGYKPYNVWKPTIFKAEIKEEYKVECPKGRNIQVATAKLDQLPNKRIMAI